MNHCECLKSVSFIIFLITVPHKENSKAIMYKYNNFVTVSSTLEVHNVLHAHHWRLAHVSVRQNLRLMPLHIPRYMIPGKYNMVQQEELEQYTQISWRQSTSKKGKIDYKSKQYTHMALKHGHKPRGVLL
jgi:hypothetical protein